MPIEFGSWYGDDDDGVEKSGRFEVESLFCFVEKALGGEGGAMPGCVE